MNDKKYVKGEGERLGKAKSVHGNNQERKREKQEGRLKSNLIVIFEERHKSGKLVKEQDADNNGSQHDSDQGKLRRTFCCGFVFYENLEFPGEAEDHQRKKDTPESPSKKDNASLHD